MKALSYLLVSFIIVFSIFYVYLNHWDDILFSLFGIESEFTIYIGDQAMKVTVADTLAERKVGLSNVAGLRDLQGKLLIFDDEDYHGIWMKDMLFPIDVIWIDNDLEIVHIESNVQPSSYPDTIYGPPKPARYILETKAFFASSYKLNVGEKINIPSDLLTPDISNRLLGQ